MQNRDQERLSKKKKFANWSKGKNVVYGSKNWYRLLFYLEKRFNFVIVKYVPLWHRSTQKTIKQCLNHRKCGDNHLIDSEINFY